MNNRYDVNGVEETWAVAKAFAAELKPGDVVCLEGDLGAGRPPSRKAWRRRSAPNAP